MIEALQFEFIQNALFAGFLASVLCGVIGSLVVVKRIVFIAGGVAHASYGGIGLAFFFGLPVLPSALGFALGITWLMARLTQHRKHRSDSIIGVLWAAGMAFGIILTDLTPGYQTELISYLFGSILAVPTSELLGMLVLNLVVVGLMFHYYRDFLALAYDEEFARVRGVPVDRLYLVLLLLIAASVVIVIRVVGLILVLALLTIAPLMVERYAHSLSKMMASAIGINLLFTMTGLGLSYLFDLTSGAAIIAVAVFGYGLSWPLSRWFPPQL